MYESFYSLSSDPFRLLPDPEVCFPHRSCAKAWAYLRYALKRGEGIVVVTGPPGSGKTTLAERLLNELNPAKTVSVRLIANELNPTDLLRKLAYSFGLPAEGMDRAMLAHRIERYLIELEHSSRQALVLIDEAQTLSHQSLEAMRLLTDLQSRSKPVLQLFLLGQEELEGVMSAPGMAQFQQRVIASSKLHRMDLAETKSYLEYRLGFADWSGDPTINGPAVMAIYRYSRGLPRHVNKICSRLLLHGCTEEKHTLKQRDVMAVVQDLRHELLAPMENEPEKEVDLSDSTFDSVYELALVPAPRPQTPAKSTQQSDMTALFLNDDVPSQSAHGLEGTANGPTAGPHRGRHARGRHYYRSGRPRKFGFRRRVYHLFRLPRVLLGGLWRRGARWTPAIGDFLTSLAARARMLAVRAAGLSRDQFGGMRPALHKLWQRFAGLPRAGIAGLAGVLVAAIVIADWVGDGESLQPTADGGLAALQKEPLSQVLEGDDPALASVLDKARLYVDVAELPVGRGEFVASALSAESALRKGMVAADVADYRGLMSSDPAQLLLGRTTSNVAGGVIGRVTQDTSTIDVWSLANKDDEEGRATQERELAQGGLPDEGKALSDEPEDDDSIALIVSDETGISLDFVRFLPAPAAGARPTGLRRLMASEPQGSGETPPVPATESGEQPVQPLEPAMALVDDAVEADEEAAVAADPGPTEVAVAEVVADTTDQEEIDRLLQLADEAIQRNRLLMPRKRAAYTYLQQVLKIDPDNRDARSGIARIVRRYHVLAKSAFEKGDFDNSRRLIERGLRVDRRDSGLLALRQELDQTIAEAEAAELAAAELARMAMQPPKSKPTVKRKEPAESSFSSLMRLVNGLSADN